MIRLLNIINISTGDIKKYCFLLIILFILIPARAHAQITTAAIRGQVTDTDREPVAGATVIAIHEPSGTRYGILTNSEGRYTIRGMRAGGPYKIVISYFGMENKEMSGIVLRLGQTFRCDATLTTSALLLDQIVVTGKAKGEQAGTGGTKNMTSADIGRMPSVTRGIADVIRLNPQVRVSGDGIMYFLGTNNRYNAFRIDGVANNDVYGLADNGFNGGQAGTQPISMEIIEQIQINVAPFDIRQSGFTGGSINAVTKSGTNNFHGTVYGFGNNQHLIGDKYRLKDGAVSKKYTDQYEYQTGITLGGPIFKNKLFFFANYEKTDKTYRNPYSCGTAASRIDAEKAAGILKKLQEIARAQRVNYGGNLDATDVYSKSDKAGLKLDWNLHGMHKASFRWSFVSARQLNSASDANYLNASDFSYDFVSKTHSFVLELQSRLSNKLSNEFRASYVCVRDRRKPGPPFPMVQISNVGDGTLNLGNDRSSMANTLSQDIWSFTDNLTWYTGRHALVLGMNHEFYHFSNLFIQDAYGSYFFSSPDDFYAGNIKQYRFARSNVEVTGTPRWATAFSAGMSGFYLQDNFNVDHTLDFTFGLRMDIPLFFDTPAANAAFNDFMVSKNRPYRTNSRLSNTPMFSPRFGFRWSFSDTDAYVLRGGIGIFTGRIPFVWLSNNFANTGVQLSSYIAGTPNDTKNLTLILDPEQQEKNAKNITSGSSQIINVFDRNFVFPQDLRADLALNFRLGGIRWTAEAIYSKTLHNVSYRNLAVDLNGKTLAENFPHLDFDRRPLLGKIEGADNYAGIYLLHNTNRGYAYTLSLTGERNFGCGLDIRASYTFLKSMTPNNGTASVAASNWQSNYTVGNPNAEELCYSSFNVPHNIHAAVFYTKNWNTEHTTTIGLTCTGNSGIPYSVCYNGDLNGDGAYNDLIYIPTDAEADQMKFTATSDYTEQQQRANLKAWLARDNYMKTHRGQYYRRNAGRKKFEYRFDFRFSHRFNFSIGKHMHAVELSFDMINAANLFNKDWGRASDSTNYYNPITYKGNGNFQFLHDSDYNMHAYNDYYSRWRGQAGIKFIF